MNFMQKLFLVVLYRIAKFGEDTGVEEKYSTVNTYICKLAYIRI